MDAALSSETSLFFHVAVLRRFVKDSNVTKTRMMAVAAECVCWCKRSLVCNVKAAKVKNA
jgi:hypothetical protein